MQLRHKKVEEKRQERLASRDVNKSDRASRMSRINNKDALPETRKSKINPIKTAVKKQSRPSEEEIQENKAEVIALQLEVTRLKEKLEEEAREAEKAAEAQAAAEEVERKKQELEELTRQREQLRVKERKRLIEVGTKRADKLFVQIKMPLLRCRFAEWSQATQETTFEMRRRGVVRRFRCLKLTFSFWSTCVCEMRRERIAEDEARDAERLAVLETKAVAHDTIRTLSKCFLGWEMVHRSIRTERELKMAHEQRRGRIAEVLEKVGVRDSVNDSSIVNDSTAAALEEHNDHVCSEADYTEQQLTERNRVAKQAKSAVPGPKRRVTTLQAAEHEASRSERHASVNPYGAPAPVSATSLRPRPAKVKPKEETAAAKPVDRRQLAMLNREAERQKRRDDLNAKYAAKEEARLKEIALIREREIKALEEEKRAKLKEKRMAKQAKLQAEEDARRQKEIFQQQLCLARIHCSRNTVTRGWCAWVRAVAASEANVILADRTWKESLLRRGVVGFVDAVMHRKTIKCLSGGNILNWCLRTRAEQGIRAAMREWQHGFRAWRSAMSCIGRNRRKASMRKSVRNWYHGAVRARAAIAARKMRVEKIVWDYCALWATRDGFHAWIRWISEARLEKEQDERKNEMRRKASSWLTDYRKGRARGAFEARP